MQGSHITNCYGINSMPFLHVQEEQHLITFQAGQDRPGLLGLHDSQAGGAAKKQPSLFICDLHASCDILLRTIQERTYSSHGGLRIVQALLAGQK